MFVFTDYTIKIEVNVISHIVQYPVLRHYTSSLADLFIPTLTRLLLEAFNHAAITVHIHHHRQVLIHIQLSELWQRGVSEIAQASKQRQEDTIPGPPNLEVHLENTLET